METRTRMEYESLKLFSNFFGFHNGHITMGCRCVQVTLLAQLYAEANV